MAYGVGAAELYNFLESKKMRYLPPFSSFYLFINNNNNYYYYNNNDNYYYYYYYFAVLFFSMLWESFLVIALLK